MNKVILKGNTGGEVDLRYIGPKETALAKVSLAIKDKLEPKNKDKTYWANLIVWGKLGEVFKDHVKKGQEILVEGRLSRSSWEKDGVKHQRDEVIVESMEFCGSPVKRTAPPEDEPDIPF
ncbi:Single-stranded DNA-binding protein [Desulfarculales bacterium]